ncbi:hypothetical protein [Mucilaginibacter sp. 22184]|uniref:hypothetical protein n=1 Tax=Mucilaginibacter sp. 22184 TaxID=3453887 RepID=UPI003F87E7E8
MVKKLILLLPFLAASLNGLSQQSTQNNTFIPPSPTAASLGKFINNYGNSSTGAVNASVPVFDLQTGTLDENIQLRYNSNGFKPAEVPGWIGAGWTMSGGGVITRTVRGLPDDTYMYGYLSNLTDAADFDNTLRSGRTITFEVYDRINHNQFDFQPDLYSFHVGNYSGQFYMDFSGDIHIMPYQNLKITYSRADDQTHNIIAGIESWVISTPEGDTYTFSDKEWSRTPATVATQPYEIKTVSSWYLTNATSERGDYINYHYQGTPNVYRYQEFPSESMGLASCATSGGSPSVPMNNFSKNPTWHEVIYLSEVETKSAKVKFFTSDRNDPYQIQETGSTYTLKDKQLDSIAVYSLNNLAVPLKSFAIKYNNPSERTRAVPVEFRQYAKGAGVFNKYNFDYYSFPNVPYNYMGIDHWGYYNAAGNGSLIPRTIITAPALGMNDQPVGTADRGVNTSVAVCGILKNIKYPTGGQTTFEYEPHDYSFGYERTVYFSIPAVSAWKYYTTGDGPDIDGTFTIAHQAEITATGTIEINDGRDCLQETRSYPPIKKTFPAGTYDVFDNFLADVVAQVDPRKVGCLYRISINISGKDYYKALMDFGGGVRLKKVTNYDGINHASDMITTYKYKLNNSDLSSGVIGADPKYYYYFDSNLTVDGNPLGDQCDAIFVLRSSTVNTIPLTQGNYINYQRIEEIRNDNSKTVNYYTTYRDYSDFDPEFQTPVANHNLGTTGTQDFLRGNLLGTEVYDSQNKLLTRSTRSYKISAPNTFSQYFWTSIPIYVQGFQSAITNFVGAAREAATLYYMNKQRDVTYSNTDSVVVNHDFYYDNPLNLLVTRDITTKSDGKTYTKANIYGDDYVPLTIFTNGGNKPIEQVVYLTDNQGTRIVSGSINEYGDKGLLTKSYKLKETSPISQANFKFSASAKGQLPYPSSHGSYVHDDQYEDLVAYQYDGTGNPVRLTPKDGALIGYKWGYNQEYPVAECKNSSEAEFYYEGFEESTGSGIVTGVGHTGNKFTTNAAVNWTRPNTRTYVISYWYRSGGIWRYKSEQSYTASSFTMTGGDAYDDIRIYPRDAQVTTYTYDPLVGMTSSTDPKGETTTYEYDNFQRLLNIKDKDGNIVKSFTYHYSGQ